MGIIRIHLKIYFLEGGLLPKIICLSVCIPPEKIVIFVPSFMLWPCPYQCYHTESAVLGFVLLFVRTF